MQRLGEFSPHRNRLLCGCSRLALSRRNSGTATERRGYRGQGEELIVI
jgi:hypothetical protein